MNTKTAIICATIKGVVTALVLGEVFGGCISRPIAAWKRTLTYGVPREYSQYFGDKLKDRIRKETKKMEDEAK